MARATSPRVAPKSAKPKGQAAKPARSGRPAGTSRRISSRAKPALRVSGEAVAAKTGKTWPQWFKLLDAAGAAKWPHPGIARWLNAEQGLSGWWSQMVTVGYEQARLGRAPHQKAEGFEIGVSRTLPVPVGELFAAWHDARRRGRWLGAPLTVTKAAAPKSIRARWEDGTRLSIAFNAKGARKSQVAVQHGRLKDARTAARMKGYWAAALDRLMGEFEAE